MILKHGQLYVGMKGAWPSLWILVHELEQIDPIQIAPFVHRLWYKLDRNSSIQECIIIGHTDLFTIVQIVLVVFVTIELFVMFAIWILNGIF